MLRKLINAIFGHFRLKCLAFVIALGVWFYANSRLTQEIQVLAPLKIVPPDGYALLLPAQPITARLSVAGPSWLMERIEGGVGGRNLRLRRQLAAADLTDSRVELEVAENWLQGNMPKAEFVQVSFRGVEPEVVSAFVSPIADRELPVNVVTTGETSEGYYLVQRPVAVPDRVTVRGPAVALNELEYIETAETVRLWGLRADVRRDLALRNKVTVTLDEDQSVEVELQLSVPTVTASIYVSGEKEQEQTFTDVPLDLRLPTGFPYKVNIVEDVRAVSVIVRAPPHELKRLKPESVTAYVNLRSLASETIEVGSSARYPEQIVGDLPDGVQAAVVGIQPPQVTLLLERPAE